MYAKVALLLLGLAVVAHGETCTCSGLKACVDGKKDIRQKNHDKCVAQCQNNLPGDAADQLQQCIQDKSNALEQLKENQVDCLLNPAGGVCSAPRARRQTDRNNFFVQPSAGDFQSESNRGKWIQAGAQAQAQASVSASVDADDLLKPYHDCMHKCLQKIRPEKGEGLASGATQGAVDQLGRNLALISECQVTEKCTIDLASLSKQVQTACQTDRSDALNFKQDVKLSYCRCVRGALHKSESEMPCTPDANGGKSKGGRSD
jgi:hypothetical protein